MPRRYATRTSKRSTGRKRMRRGMAASMGVSARPESALVGTVNGRSVLRKPKRSFGITKYNNITIDGPLVGRAFQPPALYMSHRYSEQFQLSNENTTGITGSEQAFRLNSMFDPNFTSVVFGHQPRGYDQLALLYQRYRVYKVKCQVTVHAPTGGNVLPFVAVNVRPSANTTAYTLANQWYDQIKERANCTILTACQGNGTDNTWEEEFYIADIEGISRQKLMNDNDYEAATNGNPTITPYLAVAVGSLNRAPGCSAWITVSLEYFAKWTSPANTIASS